MGPREPESEAHPQRQEISTYDPRYARDIFIPIVHHDSSFLIVNKPYDLRIDGDTSSSPTLEATLYRYFPQYKKFYLVHQLDYATSGVHVWGLNKPATSAASKCFAKRVAKKTYVAIVYGHIQQDKFAIDKPLATDPTDPLGKRMCICTPEMNVKAKESYTDVTVLKRGYYINLPVTLVKLHPRTGRQHQLRVHLNSIHHPILGDYIYQKPLMPCFRMFLHAMRLELVFEENTTISKQYENRSLVIETENPFLELVTDLGDVDVPLGLNDAHEEDGEVQEESESITRQTRSNSRLSEDVSCADGTCSPPAKKPRLSCLLQ